MKTSCSPGMSWVLDYGAQGGTNEALVVDVVRAATDKSAAVYGGVD